MFLEASGAAQRAALKSRRPSPQLVKGRLHPLQDLAPLSATSSAPARPRGKIAKKKKKKMRRKRFTLLCRYALPSGERISQRWRKCQKKGSNNKQTKKEIPFIRRCQSLLGPPSSAFSFFSGAGDAGQDESWCSGLGGVVTRIMKEEVVRRHKDTAGTHPASPASQTSQLGCDSSPSPGR